MYYHVYAAAGFLAAAAFVCNLPLGRWRVSVKKFSTPWFLAVHLSIPLIIYLRSTMGLGELFIPLALGAALLGQLVGGASLRGGENNKTL